MSHLKPILIILILGSLFFVSLNIVQAQGSYLNVTAGQAGYEKRGGTTIGEEISSRAGMAIKSVIALAGAIFLALMIYGGFLWMTAAGVEEQVGKSQKTISRAVIGIVIVLGAYALTDYALDTIVTATKVDVHKIPEVSGPSAILAEPIAKPEPIAEPEPEPEEKKICWTGIWHKDPDCVSDWVNNGKIKQLKCREVPQTCGSLGPENTNKEDGCIARKWQDNEPTKCPPLESNL